MKRIGIIGGLGPESTIDYYKLIIGAFKGKQASFNYPEIIIYSVNLSEFMELLEARKWGQLAEWLLDKVRLLAEAGAEFAAIGSNTPHIVFDEVSSKSPVPMLSIVEATCARAQAMGLKRLGLLGTAFTMSSDFYQKAFRAKGLSLLVPEERDRKLINDRLFSEIELGIIKDSTRQELLSVVVRMIERQAIDSVVLGCTELPLILDRNEYGIPFLNTTAIHAEGIARYCLGG
jgi:aspartate racemase